MKVKPYVFAAVVLVLFFGVLAGAKATGIWSVSGKLTSSGEKLAPTGQSVDEIKGWMTLGEVSAAYDVPFEEIVAAFGLPDGTLPEAQLKTLESDQFSVTALRTWLSERVGQ